MTMASESPNALFGAVAAEQEPAARRALLEANAGLITVPVLQVFDVKGMPRLAAGDFKVFGDPHARAVRAANRGPR